MKNPLIVILIIIAIVSSVISCQKEFSIDDLDVLDQKASGTLTDSSGNCFSDSVHGNFFNGVVPTSDSDFVDLQVNVDTPGLYNIKTDLQNGFMFADSGYFTTVGVNKIALKPIGTPNISPSVLRFIYGNLIPGFI